MSTVPPPHGLYSIEALLGEWRASRVLSYLDTLDARTYQAAAREGLRTAHDAEVARDRALHDHTVTRALMDAIASRAVVAFMGGHKLGRSSGAYKLVADIARVLTSQGFLVVSGGGPGAMEASHLGARMAGRPVDDLSAALIDLQTAPEFPGYKPNEFIDPENDFCFNEELVVKLHAWQKPAFEVARKWPDDPTAPASIGIPTWLYGHEPPTPLASAHAKYFENSIREDGLLAIAKAGVIFAPGAAGTLQEIFQDAAQNYYFSVDGTRSPMVFLDWQDRPDDDYWSVKRPVKVLLEGLFDEEGERILHFVNDVQGAVNAIAAP